MVEDRLRSGSGYSESSDGYSPARVLVIRIGRLGDTILATPLIEVLRQAFGPGVLIDFVVSPGASEAILKLDQRINRVFPITRRRLPWRIHPNKRVLEKHSRDMPYNLVVNLECGEQCDDFIKFVDTKKFLGRPLIHPRHLPGRHCVDTEKSIYADLLGAEATALAEPSLVLRPDPELQPIHIDGDYVMLNPGFSGIFQNDYRSHRAWPISHWAKLIGLITRQSGLKLVINGTQNERQYFDSLLEMPGVHSLFGSPLPVLIRMLEQARCVISVDTGTMHLATALGTPVIALFGPSNFKLTGPYSRTTPCKVLTSGIDCQPCYQTPAQKKCRDNRCMRTLSPEEVYNAFDTTLARYSDERQPQKPDHPQVNL